MRNLYSSQSTLEKNLFLIYSIHLSTIIHYKKLWFILKKGEKGDIGDSGAKGSNGEERKSGKNCTIKKSIDNSYYKVICGNDSIGIFLNARNGIDGNNGKTEEQGENGTSCTANKIPEGIEILCDGITIDTLKNGSKGDKGIAGKSCFAKKLPDNLGYKIECNDDSVGVILNSKKGADGKIGFDGKNCTITELNDKSGYKILCDNDSLGVLLNGKNGPNGNPDENCQLTYKGEGIIQIKCGNDSTQIYKALCETKPYDPSEKICLNNELFNCNGEPYNPTISSCYNNTLYSCGGLPYTPPNEYCEDGEIKATCGEISFDSKTQFCDGRDNKLYKYKKIGSQTWMAENLNYSDFVATPTLKKNSWCYNDSLSYCEKYGRLYTWASALDKTEYECGFGSTCDVSTFPHKGICPDGWHLPQTEDFDTLRVYVSKNSGTSYPPGYFLLAAGWNGILFDRLAPRYQDPYGFSALPSGYRYVNDKDKSIKGFEKKESRTYFWTSKENMNNKWAVALLLGNVPNYNEQGMDNFKSLNKDYKASIRCLKDE